MLTKILTSAEAQAQHEPGTAYVVVSGLSAEEKLHVLSVVEEVNQTLAAYHD